MSSHFELPKKLKPVGHPDFEALNNQLLFNLKDSGSELRAGRELEARLEARLAALQLKITVLSKNVSRCNERTKMAQEQGAFLNSIKTRLVRLLSEHLELDLELDPGVLFVFQDESDYDISMRILVKNSDLFFDLATFGTGSFGNFSEESTRYAQLHSARGVGDRVFSVAFCISEPGKNADKQNYYFQAYINLDDFHLERIKECIFTSKVYTEGNVTLVVNGTEDHFLTRPHSIPPSISKEQPELFAQK